MSRTIKANVNDAGVLLRVCVHQRGRNPDNPSDRTTGSPTKQRLEPDREGMCGTLTSVQKDNHVLEIRMGNEKEAEAELLDGLDYSKYRIRKITPLESWRLMGFKDEDFQKAAAVNSNSQLYKEAGNSIVRQVLIGIFSQLNIQGIKPWNERRADELQF